MLEDLQAVEGARSLEVARGAHRLKSASTTIGTRRLAALCEKIEEACGHDNSSSSARLVTEAREAAAQLTEMLRKIPLR